MSEKVAVIGLGYVGLPVAVALAREFDDVVGFDISESRVSALQSGHDWTGEIEDDELETPNLGISSDAGVLADRSFIIVTVPTPIDSEKRPDLGPIEGSCRLIGPHLTKGALVLFESTVYPGVTDDVCGPLLEKLSGLKRGKDFTLGYSPERINPGDKIHRLETVIKVVAAEDANSLERVKAVYGAIIEAGLHVAPTIKVAEAAKVIENIQRDLNIALMNELALIFDRMDISTRDVLEAASTKWNFLNFTPGLVGGHCIGVDPYYLTSAAERLGYRSEVILAGRRINDNMAAFVARKTIKLMIHRGIAVKGAKVGVLGLTFKADVPDLRNSKVPDIVNELRDYAIEPMVHDPLANHDEAQKEFGITLQPIEEFIQLDALIVAVPHRAYCDMGIDRLAALVLENGLFADLKGSFPSASDRSNLVYWTL